MRQSELERVLDVIWGRFGRSQRFRRGELADYATTILERDVNVDEISAALQSYRVARRRRFDISAEEYGRAGTWGILGVHNHASTRRREVTTSHARYTVVDALRRQMRDLGFEVLPALQRNGASTQEIRTHAQIARGECFRRLAEAGFDGDELMAMVDDVFEPVASFLG